MTGCLKPEGNFLAVEVNNTRITDAIPAMAFDWWNYGGITRDVMLVSVPDAFIRDYFIRLGKDSDDRIDAITGARILWKLCGLTLRSHAENPQR